MDQPTQKIATLFSSQQPEEVHAASAGRSGTLTDRRYEQTFAKLAKWAKEADRLDVDPSRGPVTARAVGIMRTLDREIYKKTDHDKSLDDVVRLLTDKQQKVNLDRFRQAVVEVMDAQADALSDKQLGFDVETD